MDEAFRIIEYHEIDLSQTERLLKEQGLLLIDLGWFRARTLMALINQERRSSTDSKTHPGLLHRLFALTWDLVSLMPFVLISSKLVVVHCIFVNHCNHAEWRKLANGKYRFSLL